MEAAEQQIEKALNKINTTDTATREKVLRALTNLVAELIEKDFARLVQVLYRMDVEEEKLKKAFAENVGKDAATIIAELILQRHLQKLQTRAENKKPSPPSAEECW